MIAGVVLVCVLMVGWQICMCVSMWICKLLYYFSGSNNNNIYRSKTSLTSRWKGILRMSSSVDFWYLRICLNATVPGRKRWGFLTPPLQGADLRAALVARDLRGAFPPVDLRAVCLVRAAPFPIATDAVNKLVPIKRNAPMGPKTMIC